MMSDTEKMVIFKFEALSSRHTPKTGYAVLMLRMFFVSFFFSRWNNNAQRKKKRFEQILLFCVVKCIYWLDAVKMADEPCEREILCFDSLPLLCTGYILKYQFFESWIKCYNWTFQCEFNKYPTHNCHIAHDLVAVRRKFCWQPQPKSGYKVVRGAISLHSNAIEKQCSKRGKN